MGRARTWVFWGHLAAGCLAGLVILVMSATGAVLAFQPQLLERLERDQRYVSVPSDAVRLGPSALLRQAAAARPRDAAVSITMASDPSRSVTISFGPRATVFVDPYSGRVLGSGAPRVRALFQSMTEWHRWLGATGDGKPVGKALTGAANLAFLVLAISGLFLWWPRRLSRQTLRTVAVPHLRAHGRLRDYNWHHVTGFWLAPVLIVLTVTGAVMSYAWAGTLVYRLTGSPVPAQAGGASSARMEGHEASRGAIPDQLDRLWADAAVRLPTWETMTLRMPGRAGAPLVFTMTDGAQWNRFARTQLIMDGATGAVVRWEPYADASTGQKLRGWMRFAHTGELGGLAGQMLAALGCLAGVVLVWTGMALAWRRCAVWLVRVPRAAARAA